VSLAVEFLKSKTAGVYPEGLAKNVKKYKNSNYSGLMRG
jgi:hypothetical protein